MIDKLQVNTNNTYVEITDKSGNCNNWKITMETVIMLFSNNCNEE